MDDIDTAFSKALAKFDFDATKALMDKKEWKWFDTDGVPTVDDAIENVVRLFNKMKDLGYNDISSGGFGVSIDHDDGCVSIDFCISVTEYFK